MDLWTDSELVVAVRTGDKAAFGVLIERYGPMVTRLAQRMIDDADLAHDIAQDALLQAFLSLDSLRADRSFRSWLYGVTLNVCRTYIRSRRNVYSLDVLVGGIYREPLDEGPTPEEITERLELRRVVGDAVETLSPANRAAVMLCYYEGFSLRDGAAMLGISVTALKGRLHKARHQLETYLLSVYPSMAMERGAIKMIPVKIADVMNKPATRGSEKLPFNQVILLDEAGQRVIVIWIGEAEGLSIAMGLSGYDLGRPTMAAFTSRLLKATSATLERVEISTLKDDVFYATVKIRTGDGIQDVDARPSDALALAVQVSAPIYVSEALFEKVGRPLTSGAALTGKGIKNIIAMVNSLQRPEPTQVDGELQAQRTEQLKRHWDQLTDAVLQEAFDSNI